MSYANEMAALFDVQLEKLSLIECIIIPTKNRNLFAALGNNSIEESRCVFHQMYVRKDYECKGQCRFVNKNNGDFSSYFKVVILRKTQ